VYLVGGTLWWYPTCPQAISFFRNIGHFFNHSRRPVGRANDYNDLALVTGSILKNVQYRACAGLPPISGRIMQKLVAALRKFFKCVWKVLTEPIEPG
jgi:hypothetical protein